MHARHLAAFVALVSLSSLAGCSKGPEKKLQGRWIGDRIDGVSGDGLERATAWVKGTAFEFAGEKVTVSIPTEEPRAGTFHVTKAEGANVTLAILREGHTDTTEVTLENERTMRWDIGAGRSVTMVRVQ